jgi:hypothetical protein
MKCPIIITSKGKIGLRSKLSYDAYVNIGNLIASALTTSSGKAKLAASMIAPIRKQLSYQGIARSVFAVQQLPLPFDLSYKEVTEKYRHDAFKINSKGKFFKKQDRNRVTVPTFQVYSNPTIRLSEVKRRRFNIIDRSVQKARQEIMAQEDANIFSALDAIESGNKEE